MKILITNDDGIDSPWLKKLVELSAAFGEVTVVAPDSQCSASSHRITLLQDIEVTPVDFPEAQAAFRINGTPADCVRVGVRYLMKEQPGWVFSGINDGFNTGFDIPYSGTVAAAMESLLSHIPSIAFSTCRGGFEDTIDRYFHEVTETILRKPPCPDRIWNVNFPGCHLKEAQGLLWDRIPAPVPVFSDSFEETHREGDTFYLKTIGTFIDKKDVPFGSDIEAVLGGYVSIGTVRSIVL